MPPKHPSKNKPSVLGENQITASKTIATKEKKCSCCQVIKIRESYSNKQWKKFPEDIRCHSCITTKQPRDKNEKLCRGCRVLLKIDSFSKTQWKGPNITIKCKPCVKKEAPKPQEEKRRRRENTDNGDDADDLPKKSDGKKMRSSKGDDSHNTRKEESDKGGKKEKKEIKVFSKEEIKRRLMERADSFPNGKTRRSFRIQCVCMPITQQDEHDMMDKVIKVGYYGPFREASKEALALASYIESNDTNMTMKQALSLRSAILQNKAMKRNYIILSNAKKLFYQYKRGKTIVELARDLDCPPMNVFRAILSGMQYGKGKIKKSLKNPQKELKEREQNEFVAAEAVDCVSMANQDELHKAAAAFEDDIAHYLRGRDIAFVTQAELTTEQKHEFGKVVLTPDFLLLDDVEVNGEPIKWIDAKAYYGANIPSQVKDTAKQMNRYSEQWGTGAIIFLRGYNETISIDKCVLLSANALMEAEVSPS